MCVAGQVHGENVGITDTLFFLLVGCFCCVSRSRLAASGSTEGPSSNPTSSQLVSEASAIEDSVRPDGVADICSSQTIKRVCFRFSPPCFSRGCINGVAILNRASLTIFCSTRLCETHSLAAANGIHVHDPFSTV